MTRYFVNKFVFLVEEQSVQKRPCSKLEDIPAEISITLMFDNWQTRNRWGAVRESLGFYGFWWKCVHCFSSSASCDMSSEIPAFIRKLATRNKLWRFMSVWRNDYDYKMFRHPLPHTLCRQINQNQWHYIKQHHININNFLST